MKKFICMAFAIVGLFVFVSCGTTSNFEKLNDKEDWTSISGVIKANIARDIYSLPCYNEDDLYTVVDASNPEEARLKAYTAFSYYEETNVNGNAENDFANSKNNFKSRSEISTKTEQNEIQNLKNKDGKYLFYKQVK